MASKNKKQKVKVNKEMEKEQNIQQEEVTAENQIKNETEEVGNTDNKQEEDKVKEVDPLEELQLKLSESQDKYMRLSAEFDNYRKRTLREKADLLKSAGEQLLVSLLPVVDDFERGMATISDAKDIKAVKDGVELIYSKFTDFLKQNGVHEIKAVDEEFDTDLHEAVTKIPAPNEDQKGKIVDVIQKGYKLNDKVIRFAKVVVGE
ncbi:MAG: nucleotide exchange factor GrpE [Bacteroidota bacterium]